MISSGFFDVSKNQCGETKIEAAKETKTAKTLAWFLLSVQKPLRQEDFDESDSYRRLGWRV
jgi:hypothetical protein